jgi:hypothetical protein
VKGGDMVTDRLSRRLALASIAGLLAGYSISAQSQATPPAPAVTPALQRPSFAGVWKPSDPAKADTFFSVGITWVPGDGRIAIEQSSNRLTVTMTIPDAILDKLLSIQKQYYPTIIYRIDEPSGRGGFGSAGDLSGSWQGDRLVIMRRTTANVRGTTSLLMDGDRLKKENYSAVIGENKETTTSEWFDRIK